MSQIDQISVNSEVSIFLQTITKNLSLLSFDDREQIKNIAIRLASKEKMDTKVLSDGNEKIVEEILRGNKVGAFIKNFIQSIENKETLSDYSVGAFGFLPQGGHGDLFASKKFESITMNSLDSMIDQGLRDVSMEGYISKRLNVNRIGVKNGTSYYILDRACRTQKDNRSGNHFVLVLGIPLIHMDSFQEIFNSNIDVNVLWEGISNQLKKATLISQDITALPIEMINIAELKPENVQRFMNKL